MNFDQALDVLLGHEGDYSDNAFDPGRKTRYGITEAVARQEGYQGDMRQLPLELAKRIYRERYWNPVRADELPAKIRYLVFDAAVNSGPGQSIRWLQRAVGATVDGKIGPQTLNAVSSVNSEYLYRKLLGQRLRLMTDLTIWQEFGRGWARRIADLLEA